MLTHLKAEYSAQAYRRGLEINKLLVALKHQDIHKQLLEVNRFFNQFEYLEDHIHWGERDYSGRHRANFWGHKKEIARISSSPSISPCVRLEYLMNVYT